MSIAIWKFSIYLVLIIVCVVAVVLSITFSSSNNKIEGQNVKDQAVVNISEVDEMPPFDKIVYCVVDSYEGYIELPKNASYPAKLLEVLEEWPISVERRLPNRTYLMNKKLGGLNCVWVSFNGNEYCVLEED